MDTSYVRIQIQHAIQTQLRDAKKAAKDGEAEKVVKKLDELERTLRNVLTHF